MEIKSKPGLYENDNSYRGVGQNDEFFFLSPIARMNDEEDDFDRHWVYLSDEYKKGIKESLMSLNQSYGLHLPEEDDLASFENPDYLWLSYELLNLLRAYNQSVTNRLRGGCRGI